MQLRSTALALTLSLAASVLVVPALVAPVLAQSSPALAQPSPSVTGGTVTGRVLCADTGAPARFAKVLLQSTTPNHAGDDFMKSIQNNLQKLIAKGDDAPKPQTDEQKRSLAAAARGMDRAMAMLNSSTIGLDGSYSFAGVKPGTYYVHAMAVGYIDPYSEFSDADFASTDPAVRARIAAKIPTVTISGAESVHVDLRLQRGAAVSGRILYDDGSPAAGWVVSVIKPGSPEDPGEAVMDMMNLALAASGGASVSKTDDLGRYRISGLPNGSYALRASLIATPVGISATNAGDGGSGISLAVYSGDTFTRSEAKPFSVTAGEERSAVDLTVPSRKLHSIIGHVYAVSDGHPLNVGSVSLSSKDYPALTLHAAIRDNGSFHFEYLPPGSYDLKVLDAADGRTTGSSGSFLGISIPKQEILHKYSTSSASTSVTIANSDVGSVRFNLVQTSWVPSAKKCGECDSNPADILKDLLNSSDDKKPAPKP